MCPSVNADVLAGDQRASSLATNANDIGDLLDTTQPAESDMRSVWRRIAGSFPAR